jgi:hypothetical protein
VNVRVYKYNNEPNGFEMQLLFNSMIIDLQFNYYAKLRNMTWKYYPSQIANNIKNNEHQS